mmetsp:Transcript_24669/g.39144  ORF Transcript_24669/g.39144 Transcript_24669/m.39144 type:complete len:222 (+) Transcript_24669:270-935(+)
MERFDGLLDAFPAPQTPARIFAKREGDPDLSRLRCLASFSFSFSRSFLAFSSIGPSLACLFRPTPCLAILSPRPQRIHRRNGVRRRDARNLAVVGFTSDDFEDVAALFFDFSFAQHCCWIGYFFTYHCCWIGHAYRDPRRHCATFFHSFLFLVDSRNCRFCRHHRLPHATHGFREKHANACLNERPGNPLVGGQAFLQTFLVGGHLVRAVGGGQRGQGASD